MSQKFKSKDTEPPRDQSASRATESHPSLPHRIGTSASGLVQSAFGSSSASDASSSLTSLNPEASKGTSSSHSENYGEASSSMQAPQLHEGLDTAGTSSAGESFRSGQAHNADKATLAQAAFNDFKTKPGQVHNTQATMEDATFWDEKQYTAPEGTAEASIYLLSARKRRTEGSSGKPASARTGENIFHALASINQGAEIKSPLSQGYKDQNRDGAKVVALLSDPTFSVEDEPANSWDYTQDEVDPANDVFKNTDQHSHGFIVAANPLNLIPDFSRPFDSGVLRRSDQEIASQSQDIRPWTDILSRYHDEVWGDMLPLVQEARQEIRIANSSEEGALRDRPAIRRLGMLLGHLPTPVP